MAHEVESMFSVKEVPWHGLGQILENAPTVAEAIVAAGLDWRVEKRQICCSAQSGGSDLNKGMMVCPGGAIVRDIDNSILGVVGPGYEPLQNEDALGWFQPFLDAGEAVLETAGSLKEGRRIWALARMTKDPSMEIAPGDEVLKYILIAHGHDGDFAVRAGLTPIRVVCANTLSAATEGGTSKLIKVLHRQGLLKTLENVRDVINLANRSFEATAAAYRELVARQVSEADLKKYVRICFDIVKEDTPLVRDVQGLFESGRGSDIKSIRGSWWAAYNAVTEYLTWERGKDQAMRLDSSWFGDGNSINMRAVKTAFAMAAGKAVQDPAEKEAAKQAAQMMQGLTLAD